MPYYVDKDLLIKSYENLSNGKQKMNAFLGLLTLLMHGTQVNDRYWRVDMISFAKHLDEVLYLSDVKPTRGDKKEWYILFQPKWIDEVKKILLKDKAVSAQNCAVMLMWDKPFETIDSLIKTFATKIGVESLFETWFEHDVTGALLATERCHNNQLRHDLGATGTDLTLGFDGVRFLSKIAGDISAAPFSQTLYAGTTFRKIFTICDFDFLEIYKLKTPNKTSTPPVYSTLMTLPKPFLLLAGISGTGKTHFVTDQAKRSAEKYGLKEEDNHCLVPVRPDWHEPSDLLGYISRINGTHYVSTPFLKFIIKAIAAAVEAVNDNGIQWKPFTDVPPFWLCLDEMNLAPVEQYFADYLSILETREWSDGQYSSKAIMTADILQQLVHCNTGGGENALDILWNELFADTDCEFQEELGEYFRVNGIPLPPNLIVAGTVNMDETTHGFSRKVIDRALTIDFQEFFPNDFDLFFNGQNPPKLFTFPQLSAAGREYLPGIDNDGGRSKSVEFLKSINSILKNTPFELAYRALNELLLSVACFEPGNDEELQAVWDDFLMQKILPRMEGDGQKLKFIPDDEGEIINSEFLSSNEKLYGRGSVLHQLFALLETRLLQDIWEDESGRGKRPDLLRDTDIFIKCRARKKLLWMMKRLKTNHFTDFWV